MTVLIRACHLTAMIVGRELTRIFYHTGVPGAILKMVDSAAHGFPVCRIIPDPSLEKFRQP